MVGIYKIVSPTGKFYIGQAINIERRFHEYKRLQGCKTQTILYRSFKKYGVENHNFEILCECDCIQLNELERHYQDLFDATGPQGLNCYLTKTSSKSGKLSQESIKKRQETRIRNGTNIPTREVVERRAQTRRGQKIGPQEKLQCPHCNKVGGISNMKKLHFDNCTVYTGIKRKGSPRPTMMGNTYAKVHKGKPKEIVECPYCHKRGGKPQMIQWHYENCKQKVV
jgi:group I intron endonuclease